VLCPCPANGGRCFDNDEFRRRIDFEICLCDGEAVDTYISIDQLRSWEQTVGCERLVEG
jgi:hypothetical protein